MKLPKLDKARLLETVNRIGIALFVTGALRWLVVGLDQNHLIAFVVGLVLIFLSLVKYAP